MRGLDAALRTRTLSWWHAIDLRGAAVNREVARRAAAAREWGPAAGDQIVTAGWGAYSKGHAGGVSCVLRGGGGDGGGGSARAVDGGHTFRGQGSAGGRGAAEALADDRAARRAYLATLPARKGSRTASARVGSGSIG